MEKKSENQEYHPPQFQHGYQEYPGGYGRPYSNNPYYQNAYNSWGMNQQNYYGDQQMAYHFNQQSKTPDSTLHIDNAEFPFQNKFPRLNNYENEEQIKTYFESTLADVNSKEFNPESAKNGAFFILRSTNDENIHKSIKYGIWTSSAKNNEILTEAYKACLDQDAPVYLVFSVAKSGHFIGIAQMLSPFNPGMSFKYWCEGNKWFGSFKVKWIYVKDVDDSALMHIKQLNLANFRGNIPINKMKDCSEISEKNGKEVLKIFKDYECDSSFFDCFAFLDQREDECRSLRDNDPEFMKSFLEMSKQFVDSLETKKKYNKGAEPFVAQRYQKGVNEEEVPENLEERFVITKKTEQNKKVNKKVNKKKNPKNKKYEYFRKDSQDEAASKLNTEFFKNYKEEDKEEEIEKIENKLEEVVDSNEDQKAI